MLAVSSLIGLPSAGAHLSNRARGALAFLVVVSCSDKGEEKSAKKSDAKICVKLSAFTRRRSPVRIRPSPLVFAILFANTAHQAHRMKLQLVATIQIVAKHRINKNKSLSKQFNHEVYIQATKRSAILFFRFHRTNCAATLMHVLQAWHENHGIGLSVLHKCSGGLAEARSHKQQWSNCVQPSWRAILLYGATEKC